MRGVCQTLSSHPGLSKFVSRMRGNSGTKRERAVDQALMEYLQVPTPHGMQEQLSIRTE